MKAALKIILLLFASANFYAQSAPEEFYDKAKAFEDAGDYTNALLTVDKGLEAHAQNEALYIQKVMLLFNSGRQQEAMQLMEGLVATNEYDELMVQTHSMLLYYMGNKQKAFGILEAFLQRHEVPDIIVELSSMYEEDKQFDKAAVAFAPLAQMLPDNPQAQYRYAELLLLASRANEAQEVLATALQKDPDNEALLFELANAYHEQKKGKEALETLNKLVGKYPSEANYKARAITYRALGQDDKAYADCLAMLKINPCNLDAHGFIMAYEYENRLYEKVLVSNDKVIACNPAARDIALPVVYPSLYFLGREKEARPLVDEYLATNPAEATPYYIKAADLIKNGKYTEAIPWLEKALPKADAATPLEAGLISTLLVGAWLVTEQYDALADYSDALAKNTGGTATESNTLGTNMSFDPNSTATKASVHASFNKNDGQIHAGISVPVGVVNMLKERYGIRLF